MNGTQVGGVLPLLEFHLCTLGSGLSAVHESVITESIDSGQRVGEAYLISHVQAHNAILWLGHPPILNRPFHHRTEGCSKVFIYECVQYKGITAYVL